MTSPSETRSSPPDTDDLTGLPPPRRPLRRLTLLVMAVTAAFAVFLAYGILGEVVYALKGGPPRDVGELGGLAIQRESPNAWVRGQATLSTTDVVRYSRPLERDGFRLARVEGNPKLWVEVRVPPEADAEHYVPPASFVGRLVSRAKAGMRYDALAAAVAEAGKGPLPEDAWLLIDGESPAGTRWALGLFALLIAFFAFNVSGLGRLLRRVRDP